MKSRIVFISALGAGIIIFAVTVIAIAYPVFVKSSVKKELTREISTAVSESDGSVKLSDVTVIVEPNSGFAAITGGPRVKSIDINIGKIDIATKKSAITGKSPNVAEKQADTDLKNARDVTNLFDDVEHVGVSVGTVNIDGKQQLNLRGTSVWAEDNRFSVKLVVAKSTLEDLKKFSVEAATAFDSYSGRDCFDESTTDPAPMKPMNDGLGSPEVPGPIKSTPPPDQSLVQEDCGGATVEQIKNLKLTMQGQTITTTTTGVGMSRSATITPSPDGHSVTLRLDNKTAQTQSLKSLFPTPDKGLSRLEFATTSSEYSAEIEIEWPVREALEKFNAKQ